MASIAFTPNLARHVDCPRADIDAANVADLLRLYFEQRPAVRGYVLDDQGAVRHHVKIIVDGHNIRDRSRQTDPLTPSSRVHVFQALSGG